MTRRTTSRAPGMFPSRQPSSHPNPCLGGVCSRYAGSERTPQRSRTVQNDGCQAGSRDGFEPGKSACAGTGDGLETRQSEAPRQTRTVRGTPANANSQRHAGKREEAPASNATAGAAPTTRRGMSRTPRDVANATGCRERRGMSPTPRAMARRPAARPVPVALGFRRRGRLSQKRREARTRRLADTASPPAPAARHAADALPDREEWAEGPRPGGYCSVPGSGPRATHRTADTHPSGARALGRRPRRGPPQTRRGASTEPSRRGTTRVPRPVIQLRTTPEG
jgi:hypothetical protein